MATMQWLRSHLVARRYLHNLWSGPITLIISIAMLCGYLGVAGLAGAVIMAVSVPLNMKIGRVMGRFTKRTMAARDKRVKFTTELLQGMRLLKLFSWEDSLLAQARGGALSAASQQHPVDLSSQHACQNSRPLGHPSHRALNFLPSGTLHHLLPAPHPRRK